MVGEIIIKTKLALDDFEKGLEKMVDKAKEKGQKAGEVLSKAFNKAVNVGKGLLGVVGKIGIGFGRLLFSAGALATILGGSVVGAFSLSEAIKKAFENNEQLKANIQYIAFALTKAVEPIANQIAQIIEKIVNLLFQAIQYTAYLINAWAGKNIFAGATMEAYAEYMAEAEKDSKKTAKNLKEASKQTEKFDEMNILNDNKGSGSSSAGGMTMPSFDLSNMDVEPPKWMVWIKDNWKIVAFGLGVIAGTLLLLKLGLGGLDAIIGGLVIAQIITVLIGVVNQIKNIIDFIKDPSWENFFELIKGFLGTQGLLGILIEETVIEALGGWDEIEKKLKEGLDKIVEFFTPMVDFFKGIFETVLSNARTIWDNVVAVFKFVWDKIVEFFTPTGEWFGEVFGKAYEKIKEKFGPVVNFFGDIWNKIKVKFSEIGTRAGEIVGGAFKKAINVALSVIENTLNAPIRAINGFIGVIGKTVPGLSRLSTFSFPRLAKGGIINMPGNGVMVGSAVAGERGKEGVIPLTDSQQMELLGEAIGKYITVNNVNPIYLNGRQIAREINIANKESDFAFNR